ncbi:transcription termination factor MTERF6, chloroplastic/mitochondrial-like [Durio zibethinus]|uniref:Transcription termination factor MTERF6, chloroplastic/mitochondrial-like n=1 Tax=Durio zibethinus TaxID=66656 RepID=A0A6P6A6E4_DURZI|nr:transcription termination factor MTERF6, chloroplastic/mitochondrial-like [Durio zibethinus]XP_022760526.1 transcription termination factor MTERF6, chloroplastic/mitochondrial-like [Durio zibethinus]XP_022760527.1 transcription termination factor MTERF6, chloroplastic/mitochondrial-like [Durio zibethinus]XP_022760528.1 transcription termination factor MTERF6, chloroplastic/mitochondrial-like [Durio zibethinus]
MFNRPGRSISVLIRLSHIVMNNISSKPFLFLRVRCISKTCSDASQSFTVSYLRNKLGFSPESALVVSKYVHFKTPDKPDNVIAFLEKRGFSETQIRQVIKTRPSLLCCDFEKTLLPKIQFFQSRGVSSPELSKLLYYNPRLLSCSLQKQIIPCFNQLSNLLQSDSKAITAIRRNPYLIPCKLDAYMLPNIKTLRDNGVPESKIISMFNYHPRSFVMHPDRFKEIVKEVKEMGFNPLLLKFLLAVIMFRKVSKPAMERKFDVYKKWGWSEQEIWEAFRKYPGVLEASKEKIAAIMDFLVNKMGFQSLLIANQPSIFGRSLEKVIVPRGLFAQDLLSKGLIKDFRLSALFGTSEKVFVQKFVNQYEDKAPELLKLYKEKMDLAVGYKHRSG